MTIGILNYGLGNIRSLINAIHYGTGLRPKLIDNADDVYDCSVLFLPGVGTFETGMRKLKARSFDIALQNFNEDGRRIVGICLGMQLLFKQSTESSVKVEGLNLVSGAVRRLAKSHNQFERIPSMGWYRTKIQTDTVFYEFNGENFYYVHSYHCIPSDARSVIGNYDRHSEEVVSIVQQRNVYGFQFHPEKSGEIGIQLLKRVCNE